jgi:hypothetical protein
MALTLHLEFNLYDAEHRRAAEWLAAQADPAQAIVRLLRAASEAERRLRQWEELATLLSDDLRQVRQQMTGRPPAPKPEPEVKEDPESAKRLDTMFR